MSELRQAQREQAALQLGVENYYRHKDDRALSEQRPGRILIQRHLMALAEAIKDFLAPQRGGTSLGAARKWLVETELDSDTIAFLTLRQVLSGHGQTVQRHALALWGVLQEAATIRQLSSEHAHYVAAIQRNSVATTIGHQRRVLLLKAQELGVSLEKLPKEVRLVGAAKLLDLAILATGLFLKKNTGHGKTTEAILCLTPEAAKWLEQADERLAIMRPQLLPMVCPPVPWTTHNDGGYLLPVGGKRMSIIRGHFRESIPALPSLDEAPTFYAAINAVQAVKWHINTPVLDVMMELWKTDAPFGVLPQQEKPEEPPRAWLPGEAPPEDALKVWRRARTRQLDMWHHELSKRLSVANMLRIATDLRDEPSIWFPHVVDWRGRTYPVPSTLTPQGSDASRGLLAFAEGVELGADGYSWLAQHVAGLYDIGKATPDELKAWTEANMPEILATAEDPFNNRYWTEAGKPWQFLAGCFELLALSAHRKAGLAVDTFVSHLPIPLDGTCSGLQHLSAMLRDAIGGITVNLTPTERPQDVYSAVALIAKGRVARDIRERKPEAEPWFGEVVCRALCKRAVMTSPYGVKKYGVKQQLVDYLSKVDTFKLPKDDPLYFPAIAYMAEVLWEAVGDAVAAAREVMLWFQSVSKVFAAEHKQICWTAPSGFRVAQAYRRDTRKRVKTYWGQVRADLTIRLTTEELHPAKQTAGISPNIIHSYDASQLAMVACRHAPLSLAVVHDSFGTHAGHTAQLARILRETFIDIYSVNQLEELYQQFTTQLSPKGQAQLVPPPGLGTLDIAAISNATFMFMQG